MELPALHLANAVLSAVQFRLWAEDGLTFLCCSLADG